MMTIKYEAPEQCSGCGRKTKNIEKKKMDRWIMFNAGMILPGLALFMCPICGTIHGNSNLNANLELIEEEQKKVILPASAGVGIMQ